MRKDRDWDLLRQKFTAKRERLGLSLRDVEKLTGVSFASLGRFERKVGMPTKDTVARVVSWVVRAEETPKRAKMAKASTWRKILGRIERIERHLGIYEGEP